MGSHSVELRTALALRATHPRDEHERYRYALINYFSAAFQEKLYDIAAKCTSSTEAIRVVITSDNKADVRYADRAGKIQHGVYEAPSLRQLVTLLNDEFISPPIVRISYEHGTQLVEAHIKAMKAFADEPQTSKSGIITSLGRA